MGAARHLGAAPEVDVEEEIARAESAFPGDPAGCTDLLDRVEPIAQRGRDLTHLARITQLRGRLACQSGRYPRSLAAFRAAHRHWLAAGKPLEAAGAALYRTNILIKLGEYDDAADRVARILDSLDARLRDPGGERLLTRLHAHSYRQLGEIRGGVGDQYAALRQYDASENLFLDLGDREGIAAVAMERGIALAHLGLSRRALDEMLRAHRTWDDLGHRRAAARSVLYIATVLAATGQVSRALELLHRVRPALDKHRHDQALLRLMRARILLDAGLPEEAHGEARAAEDDYVDLAMGERSAQAALLGAIASGHAGHVDDAEAGLVAAERIFASHGSRSMLALVHLTRAQLAIRSNDPGAIRTSCQRLHEVAGSDNPLHGAWARLLLATASEDPAVAQEQLDLVASTAASLGSHDLRLALGLARARQHRREGRIDHAVAELRRACAIGETITGSDRGDPVGGWVRSPQLEALDELVDTLLDQGTNAARIEAWRRASAAKVRRLSALVAPSRRRDPDWTGCVLGLDRLLHGAEGRSVDVERTALPPLPEGPVLEYFVLGDDVVAFVIREGQVHVRRLRTASGATRSLLQAWRQECAMVRGSEGAVVDGPGSPALERLHDLLVAPVDDLIRDVEGDPLVVIGHRHLNEVPFEALTGPDGVPLYERLDLTFTLGLAPFVSTGRTPSGPVGKGLVLAVPDGNAPSIDLEAQAVADGLPSVDVYVGRLATKDVLRTHAPSRDIVHLACHGEFSPENPLSSALRLGDGWLTAREMMDIDFDDAIVVLSACASANTTEVTAEPVGSAWACLAAGARSVVGALWRVDDRATTDFMRSFYRLLGAGQCPRHALDQARRETAAQHPHPYYWAPFRFLSAPDVALLDV